MNYKIICFVFLSIYLFTISCKSTNKVVSVSCTKKDNLSYKNNTTVYLKSDIVFLPPILVLNIFNYSYDNSSNVVWSKVLPIPKIKDKKTHDYKLYFTFFGMNNSAIYADNGDLIELSMQILPEHLPNLVFEAIKLKYPDAFIITAYTLKNSRLRGAYIATIKSSNSLVYKELTLTYNGSFVE